MSEISGISTTDTSYWTSVVAKINDNLNAKLTDGVSGSVALSGDNLVVTVTNADGKETSQTVPLADVSSLVVGDDTAALEEKIADTCTQLASDLETVAGQIEQQTGATASSTGSSVQKLLFDIYDLIKLLREVAQEQRDNARQIRETELQTQLSAIQSQADEQMYAAQIGAIVGTVLCSLQILIAAAGAGKSIADLKATTNCAASQEIDSAKNNLQTMKMDSDAALNAQIEKLGGKLPEGTDRTELDNLIGEKMTAAKNTPAVTQAKTVVDEKQAAVDVKQQKVDSLKAELQQAEENNPVDAETQNEIQDEIDAATVELKDAQAELKTATTAYNQKLAKAYDGIADTYDVASSKKVEAAKTAEKTYVEEYKVLKSNGTNEDNMKAAQAELKDSFATADYVRAKVIQAQRAIGCGPTQADINVAEGTVAAKTNALSSDIGYKTALNTMTGQMLTTVPNMLTGTFQGITTLFSTAESTKATLEEAVQKESESDRQMTQELFDQALDVIKDAKSLLQAVIQAENQSTEQIISA